MPDRHHAAIQKKLEPLHLQILRMGHLSEEILGKALRSVWERNAELAAEVARDDLAIDRLDVEIDRAVLEILALSAPVAQDLRRVIAIKTAATDLERVGDIARNIAKSVASLGHADRVHVPDALEPLAHASQRVLKNALLALANHDSALARSVIDADDEIDHKEEAVFKEALGAIREAPDASEQAVHYLLIGQSLERVGDHATNIAEEVILIVESLNLKHAEKLAL